MPRFSIEQVREFLHLTSTLLSIVEDLRRDRKGLKSCREHLLARKTKHETLLAKMRCGEAPEGMRYEALSSSECEQFFKGFGSWQYASQALDGCICFYKRAVTWKSRESRECDTPPDSDAWMDRLAHDLDVMIRKLNGVHYGLLMKTVKIRDGSATFAEILEGARDTLQFAEARIKATESEIVKDGELLLGGVVRIHDQMRDMGMAQDDDQVDRGAKASPSIRPRAATHVTVSSVTRAAGGVERT